MYVDNDDTRFMCSFGIFMNKKVMFRFFFILCPSKCLKCFHSNSNFCMCSVAPVAVYQPVGARRIYMPAAWGGGQGRRGGGVSEKGGGVSEEWGGGQYLKG